uniref:DUF155 domain-containing protein n=1 Tax=Lotharella oceanica TaxID=641309 RepID=A0A7S2XHH4_9EUKA
MAYTSFSDDGERYEGLLKGKRKKKLRRRNSIRLNNAALDGFMQREMLDDDLEVMGFCDCDEYDLDKLIKVVTGQETGQQHHYQQQQQQHNTSIRSHGSRSSLISVSANTLGSYRTFEMLDRPGNTGSSNPERSPTSKLRKRPGGLGLNEGSRVVKEYEDVVHLRITKAAVEIDTPEDKKKEEGKKSGEIDMADVFVVSWGVVVLWNTSQDAVQMIRKMVRCCQMGRRKVTETEDMDYCFGLVPGVKHDMITLSKDKSGEAAVLEKLAATLALAQSLKLSALETRIEQQVDDIKHLPKELAQFGEIKSLSRKRVQMLLGKLFITHTDLTLTSDLLDTPKLFWEEDTNLPFYKKMVTYLEIPKRTQTLDKRKDVLHELYDIIRDSKESLQATRLEWIIIWLILVEVLSTVNIDR